jgi:hypothetical protein
LELIKWLKRSDSEWSVATIGKPRWAHLSKAKYHFQSCKKWQEILNYAIIKLLKNKYFKGEPHL